MENMVISQPLVHDNGLSIGEPMRLLAMKDWSIELPSWPRVVFAKDGLVRAIKSAVDPDDIEAIALFGSSVRPLRKRLWLFEVWASDIDVMVLSRKTSANAKGDERYIVRCGDGYGSSWYEDRCQRGAFDIVVVTASEFARAVQRAEKIACDVLKEGVILVGDWCLTERIGSGPYRQQQQQVTQEMRRFERGRGERFRIADAPANTSLYPYQVIA
jgi:hypothetical protein